MASRFRALTSWTNLEILSEPYVVMTFRGYVAALEVLDVASDERYELLIGAKSLADGIEPIRQANAGMFTGLTIKIKKESAERTSPYIVEHTDDLSNQGYVTDANGQLSSEDKLWRHIERKNNP